MLQECYCDAVSSSKWTTEWGEECYFSNGSKDSCGTMILFQKSFEFNIKEVKIDILGRFIFIKIIIEEESFLLLNIYGRTKLSEKQLSLNKSQKL